MADGYFNPAQAASADITSTSGVWFTASGGSTGLGATPGAGDDAIFDVNSVNVRGVDFSGTDRGNIIVYPSYRGIFGSTSDGTDRQAVSIQAATFNYAGSGSSATVKFDGGSTNTVIIRGSGGPVYLQGNSGADDIATELRIAAGRTVFGQAALQFASGVIVSCDGSLNLDESCSISGGDWNFGGGTSSINGANGGAALSALNVARGATLTLEDDVSCSSVDVNISGRLIMKNTGTFNTIHALPGCEITATQAPTTALLITNLYVHQGAKVSDVVRAAASSVYDISESGL